MAWKVFYSYSHEDEKSREQLGIHLAPLVLSGKLDEWHDRRIQPGADWDHEISAQLDAADLILLLLSPDFLASDYCFGLEVERALTRLKAGEAKVVPVLLRPCLWNESRFSELQIIPRDAKPISSAPSIDDAFLEVATEIRTIVSSPIPGPTRAAPGQRLSHPDAPIELVRRQVRAYGRLYERIRQRMRPSSERTRRMEEVFQRMRALATAAVPLLDELASSPLPGDRLGAVAILQVFASSEHLPFLVERIGTERPFVGYHATKALAFAVEAVDPVTYPSLRQALENGRNALRSAAVGMDSDRAKVLERALADLSAAEKFLVEGK